MKRLSSGTWFLISLMLLALGAFFWLWGDRIRAQRNAPAIQPDIVFTNGQVNFPNLGKPKYHLVTQIQEKTLKSAFSSPVPTSPVQTSSQAVVAADPRFPYRLRNTVKTVGDLSKTETAILLNNATIDSSSEVPIWVPDHLRASEKTESYLLQSVGPFDQVFDEASLKHLGITKVAYIPHNTWIVRMTPEMSQRIKGFRGTQAVLPFDPYFKLSDQLLEFAVMQADIPGLVTLQLTLFKGEEEAMFTALEGLGTEYLQDGVSPFGPTVIVKTKRNALSKIASLDGVLTVETVAPRILANDLTRVRIGVDDSLTNMVSTNFHELSGKDILVNINDTGVDGAHPDLTNRVFSIDNVNLRDPDGHGTHVAGTIASSGANSPMVTNVFGSPTNANFHGMAPESKLFVLPIDLITGPLVSDAFLQERAAEYNYVDQSRTNALISNNSWGLRNVREYNSSAASFDAAVRDALPE
ncbi:MAG: S8 family serine peptidase, partial [Verrucomicrobia bacterium]|nr:S8 family serine peptidase [Verrucomicrobiota bacterium]